MINCKTNLPIISAEGFKDKVCPICSSANFQVSHKYISENAVFFDKYVYTCYDCSFSWGSGIEQEKLDRFYEECFDKEVYKRSELYLSPEKYFSEPDKQNKSMRSRQHLEWVKKYCPKKSHINVLDIGAGLGTTLYYATQYFDKPILYAYENDTNGIKYLEYLGAKVISGDLIKSLKSTKKNKFDLIVCSHFLEHVSPHSVKEFVAVLRELLHDDGILIVEVPHDDLVKFPERKTEAPPHVMFFSINSLQVLFDNYKLHLLLPIRKELNARYGFLKKIISPLFIKIFSFRNVHPVRRGRCLLMIAGKKL
ncbi:MAG: class I SAM-dependent methyltransferase [Gammaproteobacteria bacterium]|nr:class I SAM-dependent methyltransferase [Gammaproteobacteria bacterium]